MPDVLQGTLDSAVSPPGILSGHPDRQRLDYLHNPTSPWQAAPAGPFLRDELSVPKEDRVGGDERGDLSEDPSPDDLAPHGQSAALIDGQPESSATELLLEDAIRLAEVLNDRILLTRGPAGKRGNEDLPWLEDGGHPRIVAWMDSDRQLSSTI